LSNGESSTFSAAEIRGQVERIAGSDLFLDAEKKVEILRLIVEWDLTGRRADLTEKKIGYAIWGVQFPSLSDGIVRQNAKGLREKLDRYYAGPGARDPIRIAIPKRPRGFRPVYEAAPKREHHLPPPAAIAKAENQPSPAPQEPPKPPVWAAILTAGAVMLAAMAAIHQTQQWALDYSGVLPSEKHVVVLPMKVTGGESERAFSEGLREALVAKLRQAESVESALWVVPTDDVSQEKITDVQGARRAFRATLALIAYLKVSASHPVVDLTLYNAQTGRVLKRQHSLAASLPEIQYSLEAAVARMLRLSEKLDELRTRSPVPDANTFYITGLGYLQRGRDSADEAIGLFTRSVEADSDFALAYAGLADGYLLKYSVQPESYLLDLAEKSCNTALQKSRGLALAPLHVTLGTIYDRKGKYSQAEQERWKALGIDPLNSDAYLHLGLAQERLLKFQDAESAFGKVIALRPDRWSGYVALGLYYFRRSRLADAEAQLRAAGDRAPDNRIVYLDLAAVYIKQEQDAKAEQALDRCAAIRPDRPDADCLNNRGNLLHYQGHHDEAANEFERSIQIAGPTTQRLWNLSAAYRWSKQPSRPPKARPTLEQAVRYGILELARNPNDAELHARLALCYAFLDDPSKAKEEITIARKLDENAVVLFQSVRVFERLGRRDDAIASLRALWAMSGGHITREIRKDPDLAELRQDKRYKAMETASQA
jgi:tetratricopeptide (TPR) repeat protein